MSESVHPLKVAIARSGKHGYIVAAEAKVNPSALSRFSAGKEQPSEQVKERLAQVLGEPVEALFPVTEVAS